MKAAEQQFLGENFDQGIASMPGPDFAISCALL
jgi:hypothetical protein